jgi:hypothetical protein
LLLKSHSDFVLSIHSKGVWHETPLIKSTPEKFIPRKPRT